jgi:chromosome segregation ATPase
MKNWKQVAKAVVFLVSWNAWAKTDVKGALERLKANETNARTNHKQYEDNAEIASNNIVEVTAAIKQLRDQRSALNANAVNLEKNRAILDKMKAKLQEFSKDESAQMKKEEMQIAQLRATLDKLEANKAKREENVEIYKQKIAEVDAERSEWEQQKEAFASIQKDLDGKEKKAMSEREKWIEKRKGYRAESSKWDKESQLAEQQRVKFDKLKD